MKRKNIYYLCIAALLLASSTLLQGQSLSVIDIETGNYPIVRAKLYAADDMGKLIKNLTKSDISVKENYNDCNITSISCPPDKPPDSISVVLTIDNSGSMGAGNPDSMGSSNLDNAKAAAFAWIKAMPAQSSECAINSFNGTSKLLIDFTNDKAKLIAAVNSLAPVDGTNYNAGLLTEPAGALPIAKKGKYKKIIIFLTDGQPNSTPDTEEIIRVANASSVSIFAVTLGMGAPGCLSDITGRTSGRCFDNVTTAQGAVDAYITILQIVLNVDPCTIEWISNECNIDINGSISLNAFGLTSDFKYNVNTGKIPSLNYIPSSTIEFDTLMVGVPVTKQITIRSDVRAIRIDTITCNSNQFKITDYGGSPPPFTLQTGETRTLTVEYFAIDSSYTFAIFDVISDACLGKNFYANGGFTWMLSKKNTLRVVKPNGKEKLLAGSDTLVEWVGVSPEEPVILDYSTDTGTSWNIIAKNAKGLKYRWTVPMTLSDQCLFRARTTAFCGKDSLILRNHRDLVTSVSWSPDGTRLISTAATDFFQDVAGLRRVIVWDGYTGKKVSSQIIFYHNYPQVVNWSHDGRNIIIGSGRAYISYLDPINYTSIDFYAIDFGLLGLESSPDDSKLLISGSYDYGIRVLDAINGITIHSFQPYDTDVYNASWSPDGKRFAATNTVYGIKLKVMDSESGKEFASYSLDSATDCGFYNKTPWSPDGSKIAIGANNEVAIVDSYSGTLVLKSQGTFPQFSAGDWSRDGSKIAAGSAFNGDIFIFDPDNMKIIFKLSGHRSRINSLEFSPDGSRLASCSSDSTVIIWFFDKPAMEDASDTLWSIVAPALASSDVDMGIVIVGDAKDSVITRFITNPGSYPFTVDSISFAGQDADNFGIASGNFPFALEPITGRNIEFRFKPSSSAIKLADIVIHSSSKEFIHKIRGEGIEQKIAITTNIIDFGGVRIGSQKDTSIFLVKNAGKNSITIADTKHFGPDSVQFIILEGGGGGYTLQPEGEGRLLKIRFKPLATGRTSGEIAFVPLDKLQTVSAQLFGEGWDSATATLEAGTTEGPSGRVVDIPIYLTSGKNVLQAGANSFETTIRFNSTLLIPVGSTPKGRVVQSGPNMYERIIPLSLPAAPDQNGVLARFKFFAAQGNAESTDLRLEGTFAANSSKQKLDVIVNEKAGSFKLTDICHEGGLRLFEGTETLALMHNFPNPAKEKTTINYQLIEQGWVEIILYDSFGNKVDELLQTTKSPGSYQIEIETRKYPQGIYYYTLKTPSHYIIRQMVISR